MNWGDVVDGRSHTKISEYVYKTMKVVIRQVAALVERLYFPNCPFMREKK